MKKHDPSNRAFDLGEFLFGQVRDAVSDIRSKVIEEGWFGRRVADSVQRPTASLGWSVSEPAKPLSSPPPSDWRFQEASLRSALDPSFEKDWAVHTRGLKQAVDHDRARGPDIDFDR